MFDVIQRASPGLLFILSLTLFFGCLGFVLAWLSVQLALGFLAAKVTVTGADDMALRYEYHAFFFSFPSFFNSSESTYLS